MVVFVFVVFTPTIVGPMIPANVSSEAHAEIMNLSESAVKSRVHRARLAIRAKLDMYMKK